MKCIVFFFLSFSLFAVEGDVIQRIQSHLLIHDYSSALRECEQSLKDYPESEGLKRAYVRTLAENGKGDEAIRGWKEMGIGEDLGLIETLAWGVFVPV